MRGEKALTTGMPRVQKEMLACLQCGYCIEVCEAHAQTPWESVTPRGKIYYLTQIDRKNILDKLLNRNVKAKGDFVDAIYKCTGCGSCEKVCHAGLELVAFWEKIRAWLVDLGVGPKPEHMKIVERISLKRNPYDEDQAERDAWWPADVKREPVPDVVMYAGCTGSFRMKDIPKAGVRVLDRAGVKQNCLGASEICCTSPALRTGTLTLTKRAADEVVNKADAIGAKDMVMTCSGCYKTVSSDFGNHYSMVGQNVYHFTQYVEKLIKEKRLQLNHPINAKVTYHDPCHLGRHSGVFDAPRNVLKKIKGIQFVEMERNRELSRCCGAGGGYKSAFNDLAVNIAAERVKDAEAVGAEIIATACPFCVLNLQQGAKKAGSKVKVMDISEMLLRVTAPVEPAPAEAAAPAAAPVVAAPVAVPAPVAPAPVPVAAPVVAEPVVAEPVPAVDDYVPSMYERTYDEEDFADEKPEDSGELKLRRILWRRGYRYRKSYGRDKITIAFLRKKVAVFVSDAPNKAKDDAIRKRGWTVLRFVESNITDARKEAEEVIAALKDAEDLTTEDVAAPVVEYVYAENDEQELAYEDDDDVLKEEVADDPAELKLRRRLWRRGYRYRKSYGREKITIAFLRARVAVFVSAKPDDETDERLRKKGWTVLRFIESDVTDARKEAEEVIAELERIEYLRSEEAEYGYGAARRSAYEEPDDDVLKEETPQDSGELKLRRRLWRGGYRYRKVYGKEKITIAFLKARVGVYVGKEATAKDKETDDMLRTAGWTILRFKEKSITDARKEAEKVIDAIEKNLNALMNEEISKKSKPVIDTEVLNEEEDDDPADLKLRRILWHSSYRYRRRYGREKITVAFRRAKVGAFVCKDTYRRKGDDQLVKRGWTIMRFKESKITDARKEAEKVMAAVDRNLYLLSKGIIPEGANITSADVLDQEAEENTPEFRLRMALWKENRYRRNYGEYKINIAYPASKVAVFVDDTGERRSCDEKLEADNWVVLRFKGVNITDGKKEANKVIAAIERNSERLDELEFEGDSEEEEDLSYLLEDTPEGRVRRAVWNNRLRYRRNYSRYKIDMAFVKVKVAVFMDADGKPKNVDNILEKRGWIVARYKVGDITDGQEQAAAITKIVKERKREMKKKKKKAVKDKDKVRNKKATKRSTAEERINSKSSTVKIVRKTMESTL